MKFIADFHIHSPYSRATSKELVPENIDYYARLKGIKVVGTGDFTHPVWLEELEKKLDPAEPGLFKLKKEYRKRRELNTSFQCDEEIRFILTSEISTIYKKNGKVRKVHNVIFAPDFGTCRKIQQSLKNIKANITSDGRPIIGLDSRNLLEMALECSSDILFVPAHIWTPWFSILGDKSGFDSVEECFDDLTDHIYALETGLSADPPMHWVCSFLDKYTLLSNSDAHSPDKLGRNANIFDTALSYYSIIDAIKSGNPKECLGTIDFFPQEGKYHYDGHRKCNVCWSPLDTLRHNYICNVCNSKITVGVMHRVAKLSDRKNADERKNKLPFFSSIPLKEILSELYGVGSNSQKVEQTYDSLIQRAGSEYNILFNLPINEISGFTTDILAKAIERMRSRKVCIKEGFDGEYGSVKVFGGNIPKGPSLFQEEDKEHEATETPRKLINFDLGEYKRLYPESQRESIEERNTALLNNELNPHQKTASEHFKGPAIIIAGPGTGKTRILTHRIKYLIEEKNISGNNILTLTFTNKAAEEIKERLKGILENASYVTDLEVSTFHALGFSILKEHYQKTGRDKNFTIIDENDKKSILKEILACKSKEIDAISRDISKTKQNTAGQDKKSPENPFTLYETFLKNHNLYDLDDLIFQPVKLFNVYPDMLKFYREKYQWILVDEYQDINSMQYQMIKNLAPEDDPNIYVIGDPDQAIYGFRGADSAFIKTFAHDYKKSSVYRLTKSYRCSDYILQASNRIIHDNNLNKDALEGLEKGVKTKIVKTATDKSEAEFIARTIEKMIGGIGFFSIDSDISDGEKDSRIKSLSDFAILYRTKNQLPVIENALKDHNIPYQTVRDVPFFDQGAVKPIIDVLKFQVNPDNVFLRNRIKNKALLSGVSPHLIKDKITRIINSYPKEHEIENRDLFKKLLDISSSYGDRVNDFLKFASIFSEMDITDMDTENVNILTLHASKGLEFTCVFIAGCENGLIPYSLWKSHTSPIDEEKRLLYVGMTRAKRFLFLTHAEKRMMHGTKHELERSPFLDKIEKHLLELEKTAEKQPEKKKEIQLTFE